MKLPCDYILASRKNGTRYFGVTSDLVQPASQHREGTAPGFTRRYRVHHLVWYEQHGSMESAILREKQLKHPSRTEKLILIQRFNPEWRDLYDGIIDWD